MRPTDIAFTSWFVILIGLATIPPVFAWSNRLEPMVGGVSFAVTYQLVLALTISLSLIAWYIVDDRAGRLDIDVEAGPSQLRNGGESS